VNAEVESVWSRVIGQTRATALLEAATVAPVHAYLFLGPRGAGKRAAAAIFAGELLARGDEDGDGARHRRLAGN
jgi:DNA polymerase-3 subunit delta'